jgi:acylphosphatase
MKIDCYISLGCTSEKTLKENITQALNLQGVDAEVQFHRISEEEAVEIGLKGSPSILSNGVDIMPGEISGFS